MNEPVELRRSARGVVLDESNRVLLLYGRVQEFPPVSAWYTPGGRLEDGESWEEALRRELAEELCLRGIDVGPHVWTRRSIQRRGNVAVPAVARFFLVRVAAFTPDTSGIGSSEVDVHWKWWSYEELLGRPEIRLIPPGFTHLLAPLLHGDVPIEPVDAS